jgi:hypothetical protein
MASLKPGKPKPFDPSKGNLLPGRPKPKKSLMEGNVKEVYSKKFESKAGNSLAPKPTYKAPKRGR